MSRPTPFDLVFAPLAVSHFEAIRGESGAGSAAPHDRTAFMKLPATQRLLAELEGLQEDPQAEAVAEYLVALYAAWRFWEAGSPIRVVERDALETLIGEPPAPEAPAAPPAAYLQFPEHWFWARIADSAPHEPLDGMFVVGEESGRETTIVAVLGLRRDRDGFSQVTVTATPPEYAAAGALSRNPPFGSTIDGGEKAGVRSITSAAELLYLAQLALTQTSR